jgi:hypothetical protein
MDPHPVEWNCLMVGECHNARWEDARDAPSSDMLDSTMTWYTVQVHSILLTAEEI